MRSEPDVDRLLRSDDNSLSEIDMSGSSSTLSMGDIAVNSESSLGGVQAGDDDNGNVELLDDIDLPDIPNIKTTIMQNLITCFLYQSSKLFCAGHLHACTCKNV